MSTLPQLRRPRAPLTPEELGAIYGVMSEEYESQAKDSPINRRAFDFVAGDVARRVPPGARLIEIGAGPGTLAIRLAQEAGPGVEVVAADVSEAMLAHTERRAREAGVEVAVQWVDATRSMASLAGRFDALVTVNGPLTFNRDGAAIVRRFAEILRPGAPMWLALPRAAALEQLRRRPLRGLFPLLFPRRAFAMGLDLRGRTTEIYLRDPVAFARAIAPWFDLREIRAAGLALELPATVDRRLGPLPLLRRLGAFSILHGTAVSPATA